MGKFLRSSHYFSLLSEIIVYSLVGTKELIRDFKQIATAGATSAAVTEKVWGEYVASVCQILA